MGQVLKDTPVRQVKKNPESRDPLGFAFFRVRPGDRPEEVSEKVQKTSRPVILVVDFEEDGWSIEDAAGWTRQFRVYHQERLLCLRQSGEVEKSEVVVGVPMVVVFGTWEFPHDWALLVDAGASVFDRSVPSNKDCQTMEQLQARLSRLGQSEPESESCRLWHEPIARLADAQPSKYHVRPPWIEAGDWEQAIREKNS